jgi:hypothetical protein
MKRAVILALCGFAYFFISVTLFIPLRMKPIPNYNIFFFSLMSAVFLFLFYRTCTVNKESTAYVYALFAGNVLWQVIGELASVRVSGGLIQQFSDVNIKLVGGYIYVLAGWILLFMLWKTRMVQQRICFCFLMFLGIWTMELYLDNYSSEVPVPLMPLIANSIGTVFIFISAVVLYLAKKAASAEKQTVLGGLLYLSASIALVAFTQWSKPQTFYLLHERPVIEHEIKALQEELAYIDELRRQLGITGDVSISEQLSIKDTAPKPAAPAP